MIEIYNTYIDKEKGKIKLQIDKETTERDEDQLISVDLKNQSFDFE